MKNALTLANNDVQVGFIFHTSHRAKTYWTVNSKENGVVVATNAAGRVKKFPFSTLVGWGMWQSNGTYRQ